MKQLDKTEYSLQEVYKILSAEYPGWKRLDKIKAIVEHNPAYKAEVSGAGGAKRFIISKELLIKIMANIDDGSLL